VDGDEEKVHVESCDMTNVPNDGVEKKSQVVEKKPASEKCVSNVKRGAAVGESFVVCLLEQLQS